MDKLTDAEANRLDDYLMGIPRTAGVGNVETLDGFLSAVVVSPELILPAEWLAEVLGGSPEFSDAAQGADSTDLLMRAYNHTLTRVSRPPVNPADQVDDPDLPFLMLPPDDEELDLDATEPPVGAFWASGFLTGRMLRADAWDALCDDWDGLADDLDACDSLLAGLAEDDPRAALRLGERLEILGAIPGLLHDLHEARPLPEPFRREAPKVGRNDPCPCGSGIKYKKCHGAN